MKIDEHIALLREHDKRIETDDVARKIVEQSVDQMLHYAGDDFCDEYLATIIPLAIPDTVRLERPSIQTLSTFQATYMMIYSIGLRPTAKGFAAGMDAIISSSPSSVPAK